MDRVYGREAVVAPAALDAQRLSECQQEAGERRLASVADAHQVARFPWIAGGEFDFTQDILLQGDAAGAGSAERIFDVVARPARDVIRSRCHLALQPLAVSDDVQVGEEIL